MSVQIGSGESVFFYRYPVDSKGNVREGIKKIKSAEITKLKEMGVFLKNVPTSSLGYDVIYKPNSKALPKKRYLSDLAPNDYPSWVKKPRLTGVKKTPWVVIPKKFTIIRGTGASIIHRSTSRVSSQSRLFQENFYQPISGRGMYYHVQNRRNMELTDSTFRTLSRRPGFTLIRRYDGQRATSRGNASVPGVSTQQPPSSSQSSSRGSRVTRYGSSDDITGGGIPGRPQTSTTSSDTIEQQRLRTEIQKMTAELQNLKTWIETMNDRLSTQVVELGESTTSRSDEIRALDAWTQENMTRIDSSLTDLGTASTEVSQAVAIKDAEEVISKVKTGGMNIGGGVLDFVKSPTTIILLVLGIVAFFMVKSKL